MHRVVQGQSQLRFHDHVTNTSGAPFDGPVEFADESNRRRRPLRAPSTDRAPQPWTCPKPVRDFACAGMLTLAADEKKDLRSPPTLAPASATVKEMKNCATLKGAPAPSCATAPLAQVQPPPAPPPADPNGLVLTKRRAADKCSDLGGGCAFIVRITNSSQAEFNGPIEFTDVIKTADGQALPNATLEAQPLVTLAEGAAAAITCTKAGDTVTCGTGGANAKIPPGKFVDAKLTMKPGPAGGATAVRNCALLKSGGGQSCSNMALVNGPLVRLTKFGGGDTCLPRCTFAVVIQNVGNVDAKGSFKFKDTFTPASSLGGFDTLPQGGECSRGGDELFCVPNVKVLKPGELTTVTVTVFGKAKAPEYKNCVDLVPQPQAPKESLVLDTSNQGRCVTVKDTSPQTPNLVIRKQAPNRKDGSSDGHCDLKSACRFTITVTNNGLAPFTGPLRVTDKVSLGIPQFISIGPGSPQSLPWKCDSVQNGGAIAQSSITCELPPLPNGLAPGTTATLEVAVTAGTTWKGSDRLKNCAEITSDGDIGANAQKEDCAEVVLDPFNVKVAKTGDQSCRARQQLHTSRSRSSTLVRSAQRAGHDHRRACAREFPPRSCRSIRRCRARRSRRRYRSRAPRPARQARSRRSRPGSARLRPARLHDGRQHAERRLGRSRTRTASALSPVATAPQARKPATRFRPSPSQASRRSRRRRRRASCDEATPCNFNVKVSNASTSVIPGPIVIADLTRVGRTPLTNVKLVSATSPWTCIASAAPGMQCSHPGPLPPNGTSRSCPQPAAAAGLARGCNGSTQLRSARGRIVTAELRACATHSGLKRRQ